MENQLYVRIRGRILGPYDQEKLQSLARRGQLSRMHELSVDAMNWVQASTYPELFAGQDGPPLMAVQHAQHHDQTASGERTIPPKLPGSTTFNESRSNHLLLRLALCAGGVVVIALVLSIAIVMSNRNADVAPLSDDASDAVSVVADDAQSLQPQPTPAAIHSEIADADENADSVPAKMEPLRSSIPAVASDGRRYITTVKDHDDIKAAVGLVVVGVEIRSGLRRYESALLSGSAFAVGSRTGIMFTNKHVVEPFSRLSSDPSWKRQLRREKGLIATEKMWVFVAGKKYPASLLYMSPQFDFAMLKIPSTIAKPFRLKVSSNKLMDEEVRAIGFPGNAGLALSEEQLSEQLSKIEVLDTSDRGEDGIPVSHDVKTLFKSQQLQFVVTRGAICQTPYDEAKKTAWLQHTASIGPGSSGGPLVLPNGVVVGINTAISGRVGEGGAEFFRAISVGQLRTEIDRFIKDDIWTP